MACYYYLTLPNGGEIRVPASFEKLVANKSTKLRDLVNDYKKITSGEKTKTALVKYLTNNTPLSEDEISDILKTIARNKTEIINEDFNNFIDVVNQESLDKSGYGGIANSLRLSIFTENYDEDSNSSAIEFSIDGENWENIKLNDLIEELKVPIQKSYFNRLGSGEILGKQTIQDVKDNYILKQIQLDSLNIDSSIYNDFLTILNFKKGSNKKSYFPVNFSDDSELGTAESVIVDDENLEEPLIFYNEDNALSLPLALFKLLAVEKLSKNGENITEIKNRFLGKRDGNILLEPEFYKSLKNKKEIEKLLNEILPEEEYKNIKKAFSRVLELLDPTSYKGNKKSRIKNLLSTSNIGSVSVQAEKLQIKNIIPLTSRSERQFHYSIPEETKPLISANDVINFLEDNIIRNRDIILMDITDKFKGKIKSYIVPTYWKIVDNGVFIRGWYNSSENIVQFKRIVDLNEPISIKFAKLELENKPLTYTTNAMHSPGSKLIVEVNENNPLPIKLLKKLLIRGTYVIYTDSDGNERSSNVKNVYPGGIELNTSVGRKAVDKYMLKLDNVKKLVTDANILGLIMPESDTDDKSEQLLVDAINKELENYSTYSNFENIPVVEGDWIKTGGRRNKVIDVVTNSDGKETIYYLVQSSKGNKILNIDRENIEILYKRKRDFDEKLFEKIVPFIEAYENGSSIRKYNYSILPDYSKTQNGDLIWDKLGENKVLYQIVNKDKKEFITFSINNKGEKSVSYSNNLSKDAIFITNRNVATPNYIHFIEYNNFKLSTTEKNKDTQTQERKYFIPSDREVTDDLLLDSGNLAIGFVALPDFKADNSVKDVTDKIISLINNKTGKTGNKLLVEQNDKGYIKKYDATLDNFLYTPELEPYLFEYASITLKSDEENKKNHKYRIVSNNGNRLLLEYAVYNYNGDVISIKKYLNKEDYDKIKTLYVMKGNSKSDEIKALQVKDIRQETQSEIIDKLIKKFSIIYDIPIRYGSEQEQKDTNNVGKKAWIGLTAEKDDSGRSKNEIVILTKKDESITELVHEYLHLLLAAAKYKDSSIKTYENLLTSYMNVKGNILGKNIDLVAIEEAFVTDVSEKMSKSLDELEEIVNTEDFLSLFDKVLKDLGVLQIDDKSIIDGNFETVFSILNMKMADVFADVKTGSRESIMRTAELLYFDANFKDWTQELIKNGKLTINCTI